GGPGERWVRHGTEVPTVHGAGVPASAPRTDRFGSGVVAGREHGRGNGTRRNLRPARRRVRPLLGRPHLDSASLREDALRQRVAAACLYAPGVTDGGGSGRTGGRRDRTVPVAGVAHARGGVRGLTRRGYRGLRGVDVRVDPATA